MDFDQIRRAKLSARSVGPEPSLKGSQVATTPCHESNREESLGKLAILKYLAEHWYAEEKSDRERIVWTAYGVIRRDG
ncbi:MAG: hypothetical protein ACE5JQ_09280 [Candidatus Methylomirabilales bacterium]